VEVAKVSAGGACAKYYFAHFRCNVCLDFRLVCHHPQPPQTNTNAHITSVTLVPITHGNTADTINLITKENNMRHMHHTHVTKTPVTPQNTNKNTANAAPFHATMPLRHTPSHGTIRNHHAPSHYSTNHIA
jgi:hypothetical protein